MSRAGTGLVPVSLVLPGKRTRTVNKDIISKLRHQKRCYSSSSLRLIITVQVAFIAIVSLFHRHSLRHEHPSLHVLVHTRQGADTTCQPVSLALPSDHPYHRQPTAPRPIDTLYRPPPLASDSRLIVKE